MLLPKKLTCQNSERIIHLARYILRVYFSRFDTEIGISNARLRTAMKLDLKIDELRKTEN